MACFLGRDYATTLWSIIGDLIGSGGVRYARPPATIFDPVGIVLFRRDRAELPIRWIGTRVILKGLQKVAVGRRAAITTATLLTGKYSMSFRVSPTPYDFEEDTKLPAPLWAGKGSTESIGFKVKEL